MKTTWNTDYLWRRHQPVHRWITRQREQFEAKTGVPWSASYVNGMYVFRPYLDIGKSGVSSVNAPRVLMAIEATADRYFGMTDFLKVAKKAEMDLADVMSGAAYLLRTEQITIHVDRMAKPTFPTMKQRMK